jgi:protease IV
VGSYTIVDAIHKLRDDSDIKAVVLRVESPGGSSLASDIMWRELRKLGEKKPLVVSMGSVAASGGYYVASAGKYIYALPLTITGSIGIYYGKADVSGLMSKLGVNVDTERTTPRADVESFYRGFTDEERAELTRKVGQFYDMFLSRVAEGRKVSKEDIDKVGQGRVWMGQQALQNKLVDGMGGMRQALEMARKLGKLPDDAPIAEYPETNKTLLDRALGLVGLKADAALAGTLGALPPQIRDIARAVAPLAVYPSDTAMARMDWVPLEDVMGADLDE